MSWTLVPPAGEMPGTTAWTPYPQKLNQAIKSKNQNKLKIPQSDDVSDNRKESDSRKMNRHIATNTPKTPAMPGTRVWTPLFPKYIGTSHEFSKIKRTMHSAHRYIRSDMRSPSASGRGDKSDYIERNSLPLGVEVKLHLL
ncbi:uncharacterized protein VTP21DRAFT_998 [Calcarisporiella thermophila]|uniref:uncharacterized protein n=1 Tax=Calcarisporiella thermophila TaxID=911321 RepID=UPI00374410F3